MKDSRRYLAMLAMLWAPMLSHGDNPGNTAPAVEMFSPTGTAKQVRQVTARFTTSMVALGDPKLPDPFDIRCDAKGQGRWADTRNWVYDFDQDLPGGVSCTFKLKVGTKAQNGLVLEAAPTYSFNTGGPAILRSLPMAGANDVDEEQVFLLKLDAPATVDSVQQRAHCAVQGLSEEIPVEVLTGSTRQEILKTRRATGYQYFRLLWKNGLTSDIRVRDRAMEREESSITVLRCARRFPPGGQVTLLWGKGIKTESGIATTSEQHLSFRTRPAFSARVQCTRTNARAGCLPMLPIDVVFTAPVPKDLALGLRLKLPNGKTEAPITPTKAHGDTVGSVQFKAPFPELSSVQVLLPQGLVDDAGRALENAERFPLILKTEDYPPLAKFSGDFGILEAKEGGVLPVTLRNVEPSLTATQSTLPAKLLRLDADPVTIARWLRRVEASGEFKAEREPIPEAEKKNPDSARPKLGTDEEDDEGSDDAGPGFRWRNETGSKSVFSDSDAATSFSVAKPSGKKAFEVVGIPLKAPGFYVVELQSRILGQALLGRDAPRYVATSALVTDLAVHFKWGREASLVWVTHLHDATPAGGAQVIIINDCTGEELWRGTTDGSGRAQVSQALGMPHGSSNCARDAWAPLLVLAKTDADYSFTITDWDRGIEPGAFGMPYGFEQINHVFHTVLDRSLFRAGETVSMKHFIRQRTINGIAMPTIPPGPHRIVIEHQGSGQKYTLTASFDHDDIAESEWKIPAEAKLGDYTVSIQDGQQEWPSAQFKVREFRLPSMRGTVTGSATPLVSPKTVDVDLHVAYLSGGGASGLTAKLRTLIQPRELKFAGFPDFQFGGSPVAEGIVDNDTSTGSYDFEEDDSGDSESATSEGTAKTQIIPLTLDANGSARVTVPGVPALQGAARLTAELEFADANGEILTSTGHVDLSPSALAVGIHREGWTGSSSQLRFTVVVLDLNGSPQARQNVRVGLYHAERFSFRKRLIGGFYAYETSTETKKLAATCQGLTDAQGRLNCEVAPGASGEILIRAETTDGMGGTAGATASMWVFNEEQAWFGGTSGDRMDLLPEKRSYEAGDIARFQVRVPFRDATALVTVERQGVMRSFVTQLSSKSPVVEVPITDADSPNVFVSVLAIRGRVSHADHPPGKAGPREEITALVDLNKPAYRLGMTPVKVGWKPHQLDVKVTTDRSVYKAREHAAVNIHVDRAGSGGRPTGMEVAVAAIDASLLELAPNPSWDLLAGMMGESGLEVYTSTAQMQVVGKRHYGRKAVPSGGGGGHDLARELFDTLLLWKGRVILDANGDAQVNVPLNDSLSEFRIVAVASGGSGLFGTGTATIHTTQDLMLLSGLPPQVREGDEYLGTFTVRNTTDHAITADVTGSRTGTSVFPLQAQRVELAPGGSRDVVWQVKVPIGTTALRWDVTVKQVGGGAADHLKVSEAVRPTFPVRTYQATITQQGAGALTIPVERPAAAIPGRGGIEVDLRPHLGDALEGVREYMRLYRYTCIEQRLSQAVVLGDRPGWDQLMQRLPAYLDKDGMLRFFQTDALQGDDALTAYVLQLADEAGWPIAEPARTNMINALKRFAQGQLVRGSALPTADLTIRKLAAIEAFSRYDAAQKSLLDSLTIEPTLWPTSAVLDYLGILRRVKNIEGAEKKQSEALQVLRARLNFQGTVMGFSTERSDALWWLMISADSNANRMLIEVINRPEWKDDIPRLVRGALGRQRAGHWNTTVANAWGVLALKRFSARFESTPVTGTTTVHYGAESKAVAWSPDSVPTELSLPWTAAAGLVEVTHAGGGSPWVLLRATGAMPLARPLFTGYTIHRDLIPVEQKLAGHWSRGDVFRVHLELEAQSDMAWVVVDDPIPSGSSILEAGLGGQSRLLTKGERQSGMVWPAFEERRFDSFRSYYRFVPKGKWVVEYTVRLNNPGTFLQPATRVEAMYAPEMLGEAPNDAVTVER